MSNYENRTRIFKKLKQAEIFAETTAEIYEEIDYRYVPVESFQMSEIKRDNKKWSVSCAVKCAISFCVVILGIFLVLLAIAIAWTKSMILQNLLSKIKTTALLINTNMIIIIL